MTYSAEPSLFLRLSALLVSTALHVAVGVALVISLPAGAPKANRKAGERGHVLVVDLLPLPEGGAPGTGPEPVMRKAEEGTGLIEPGGARGATEGGMVEHHGAPPRGEAGEDVESGLGGGEDSKSGAPAPSGAEVQAFRARLLQHIERFRQYPPGAREAGSEGVVRVQFVMDRSGNVLEVWIEGSSGTRVLDEEAIAAVMRARPLPTPPAGLPDSFGVSLPIGFALE